MRRAPEPSALNRIDRNGGAFGCVVSPAALVDRLLERHARHAYERGYGQALADLRAMLVWVAESSIRRHGHAGGEARKTVYAFIEQLERHVERLPQQPFVEDGLGI